MGRKNKWGDVQERKTRSVGAFLSDPDATEADLREAEALFEESFRMSRQILGAAHPETKTKQNTLSQIRKKLADPDRYTGVVCTTATY